MKKFLALYMVWCLLLAALSPLAQAQNQHRITALSPVAQPRIQSSITSDQVLAGAASPSPTNSPAGLALQSPEQGDSSTLAGSGVVTPGTASVEPQTLVFPETVTSDMPTETPEQIRARQQQLKAGKPRPYVPVPEGAPARQGSISPPTEAGTSPFKESAEDGALITPEPLAPNDMVYRKDHDITAAEVSTGQRSTIHEPTTIALDNTVFFTANWYAAKSVNGGDTFTYINPYNFFPSVNSGFCCDQVTAYAPNQDMALWGLQYVNDANTGTLRIARAVGSAGVTNNNWVYYDFTPQNVGFANGNWFDYPSMTVAGNFLYVTSNVFQTSNNAFTGNVVMRLPLSNLAAGTGFNYSFFASNIGTERVTEGAGTTVYWAGFTTTTQMRIHNWPEAGSIAFNNVNLNAFTYLNRNGVATSPDGTNWAARADSRPTAAYVRGGVIGVMWTARQDATFPKPYTIHARFNEATRALITQTPIWNADHAWMYPAASPNSAGNLAGTIQIGGGASGFTAYPGTQVWIIDDVTGASNGIGQPFFASAGNDGPNNNGWGDYFSVRPHKNFPNTWVSASHSLQGGGNGPNAVPKYLWFGRERDLPAACPRTPTPISVGQTLGGTLSVSDCLLTEGKYFDVYSFSGSAGQKVVVSMDSTAFDTYLFLLGPGGTVVAQDDDGGPANNSRIPPNDGSFTLPSTGTYTIRATSFATGATGSYTVSLSPAPPCTFSITPTSQSFPQSGGANSVNVTTQTSCTWTATSNNPPWLTVTSGTPGNDDGVVGYSVAANPNSGPRTGTITIAGQTFTVTQAGTGATAGLQYYPLANPIRLLDTRPGASACDTPGTPLAGGASRTEAARIACTGIPASAQVVVGNATVVNTEPGAASGFITLYPSSASQPNVSNLNYVAGQIVPNAFTVGLGSGDGAFNIFASSSTHFIADLTGYFAP